MKTAFRVLSAEFLNEINTFSVIPTTFDMYVDDVFHIGADALRVRGDANTELAGFADAAREYGWILDHTVSAMAEPAGPVTADAFERIAGIIVAAARASAGQLDGILLGLHGAQVTDTYDDGEGELLRRLRSAVGRDIPIAVTLDPHANVSQAMCDAADILVSYRTYPHVDMRETARRAAGILQRTMLGEISPATLRVPLPMLSEANAGRTDAGPMLARLAMAAGYEQDGDVFAVSINAGFPLADIADTGPTVLVTAQGDFAAHAAFASAIADDIWRRRGEVMERLLAPEEAVALYRRRAAELPPGPFVIADYADNPGGGAYGDATALLSAMISADIGEACFGPVIDAEAVQVLSACVPGERVRLALGGKVDPSLGGGPLDVEATLVSLSDGFWTGSGEMMGGIRYSWGPTAVIAVGGIEILVVSKSMQILDLEQFRAFGIDPAVKRVVGLKSMQHFRAVFEPIASQIVLCDTGALCTSDHARLAFSKLARPRFPLDPSIDLAQWRRSYPVRLPSPALHKAISAFCASNLGQYVPGMAVAVVRDGRPLFTGGFGIANLEQSSPVADDTRFHIASCGKMFTATALLLLAEDGLVDLDHPLHRYLPEARAEWDGVTLRHLLTMSSGLSDYAYGFSATKAAGTREINLWQDYSEEEMLALIASVPRHSPPGVTYRYCNAGYDLLGIVIQRLTGHPYEALLQKRVFTPLGMHDVCVADNVKIIERRASGYSKQDGVLANTCWTAPSLYRSPAGGLLLSARDAASWLAEIARPRVLSQSLVRALLTSYRYADGEPAINGYAMGWKQSECRGMIKWRHGGMWDGARAEMLYIPERGLAVAVMVNTDEIDIARIGQGIAGIADAACAAYAPISDLDPMQTAVDTRLLERFSRGELTAQDSSDEVRSYWSGHRLEQAVRDHLAVFTNLCLELTDHRRFAGSQTRRYVIRLACNSIYCRIERQADGLMTELAFDFE